MLIDILHPWLFCKKRVVTESGRLSIDLYLPFCLRQSNCADLIKACGHFLQHFIALMSCQSSFCDISCKESALKANLTGKGLFASC